MAPNGFPGELEQMILLAVVRLEDEAFALPILRELDQRADRPLSRGALYKTLDRMESKGWVSWTREATGPDRGGHPRRRFRVTVRGVEVLRASRRALERLWDGLDPLFDPPR